MSDILNKDASLDETNRPQEGAGGSAENRQCIATGQKLACDQRVRFVLGPDNQIVPDLNEKLPGRGAYLAATPDAVALAVKKQAFKRAFKTQLAVRPDLPDYLAALLAQHFIRQLSLARKAGLAVFGGGSMLDFESDIYDEDDSALAVMMIAKDASEREAAKLQGKLRPEVVWRDIPADQLGHAFGRDSLAYAGLRAPKRPSETGLIAKISQSWAKWRPFLAGSACQDAS